MKLFILFESILLAACNLQLEFVDFKITLVADGVSAIVKQTFVSDFEPVHILFGEFEKKLELFDLKNHFLSKISFDGFLAMCLQDVKAFSHEYSTRRQNVLVFLENSDAFSKILGILTSGHFKLNGLFVFVLWDEPGYFEAKQMFDSLWESQIFNVILVSGDFELNLHTFMPFRIGSCADTSPVLLDVFRHGKFLKGVKNLFPKKMKNLNGCAVRVATTIDIIPNVMVKTLQDGTQQLDGTEIRTLTAISRSLNFKILYTHTEATKLNKTGPLAAVQKGKADLSMAFWWMSADRLKIFDCTNAYFSETAVLTVPPGEELKSFEKLVYPFSFSVWILILTCFSIGFLVIAIIGYQKKNIRELVFGENVQHPTLNLVNGFLGGTIKLLPQKSFARQLLMIFLMYSMIIRAIYVGSFFKLMNKKVSHKEASSMTEMVNEGFQFYFDKNAMEFFDISGLVDNR